MERELNELSDPEIGRMKLSDRFDGMDLSHNLFGKPGVFPIDHDLLKGALVVIVLDASVLANLVGGNPHLT